MRILVDACIAGSVVQLLRNNERASQTKRILVTRDKDFGELIFRNGLPHSGVFRLAGEMNYAEQARIALHPTSKYSSDLEGGCIVTAQHRRLRVSQSTKH